MFSLPVSGCLDRFHDVSSIEPILLEPSLEVSGKFVDSFLRPVIEDEEHCGATTEDAVKSPDTSGYLRRYKHYNIRGKA